MKGAAEDDLHQVEDEARHVAQPLEAIDHLVDDVHGSIQTAYVAETVGSSTGAEFVRFLSEEFPDVRAVLMEA